MGCCLQAIPSLTNYYNVGVVLITALDESDNICILEMIKKYNCDIIYNIGEHILCMSDDYINLFLLAININDEFHTMILLNFGNVKLVGMNNSHIYNINYLFNMFEYAKYNYVNIDQPSYDLIREQIANREIHINIWKTEPRIKKIQTKLYHIRTVTSDFDDISGSMSWNSLIASSGSFEQMSSIDSLDNMAAVPLPPQSRNNSPV